MNAKYKYLLKNTGIFAICNFASKILVFLLVPLYTKVLTTEEYGIYDLVVSSVSIILPVLTWNILDALVRYEMDNKSEKQDVILVGLHYVIGSILVVSAGIIVIKSFGLVPSLKGLEWYVLGYYVAYVLQQFFLQVARGLEKIKCMGIAGILNTAILVGSNIYFLLIVKSGIGGFFLSTILSCLIPAVYVAVSIKIWKLFSTPKFDKSLKKEMVGYSFPLVFSTISWWINSASDRYVVTWLCGIAQNGILSVSYKIPSIINTIFGMFGQAWQISAIKEFNDDSSKTFYENVIVCLNTMTIIACCFLIAFSELIGKILYAKEFFVAWELAPFLIVSTVFNSASGLLGPILSAIKDTTSMAKSAIYGAIVNVVLNVVLVYIGGAQGATIATVISAAVIYFIRKKAVDKVIHLEKDRILIFSVILLVLESVSVIYIRNILLTSILVVAVLAINYKNMKKLFVALCQRFLKK